MIFKLIFVCIAFAHVNGQTIDKTFCDSDTLRKLKKTQPLHRII